jgi:hypothetical protein
LTDRYYLHGGGAESWASVRTSHGWYKKQISEERAKFNPIHTMNIYRGYTISTQADANGYYYQLDNTTFRKLEEAFEHIDQLIDRNRAQDS